MAETKSSIFNKQATDRLNSPDDLDRYIRATNPSSWMVLVAVLALVLGLLAWGVFGSVSTSVSATGTCVDGQVVCLLDASQAAKVGEGDSAYVSGAQATVSSVSAVPVSRDEAREILPGDYLVDTLMPGDWAYLVTLEVSATLSEGVPLDVSITTESTAPISLVLG